MISLGLGIHSNLKAVNDPHNTVILTDFSAANIPSLLQANYVIFSRSTAASYTASDGTVFHAVTNEPLFVGSAIVLEAANDDGRAADVLTLTTKTNMTASLWLTYDNGVIQRIQNQATNTDGYYTVDNNQLDYNLVNNLEFIEGASTDVETGLIEGSRLPPKSVLDILKATTNTDGSITNYDSLDRSKSTVAAGSLIGLDGANGGLIANFGTAYVGFRANGDFIARCGGGGSAADNDVSALIVPANQAPSGDGTLAIEFALNSIRAFWNGNDLSQRSGATYQAASTPPTLWAEQTSAANNNWRSVCWSSELNLFCAVAKSGSANRVMTSPDGIHWTIQTSAANNGWCSVCWSPELHLFCAVANSGSGHRVMTSPDGINWTIQTSAADNDWHSVCWSSELNLFCAVAYSGTGNRVMTSPDGLNWTAQTSAADNNWRSVCWSPELNLFCAVANSGSGNRIMTSPDGIHWTTQTNPINKLWHSVCWSPKLRLFCAVSYSGTGNRVMTSPDGINWTAQTNAEDNGWLSVCWSPELNLFCAVANSGTGNRVMTSPDGSNWTIQTSAVDSGWLSVCWSPELGTFCAVSYSGSGNRIMTSPDGNNWKVSQTEVGGVYLNADYRTNAPQGEVLDKVANHQGASTMSIYPAIPTHAENGQTIEA